MKNRCTFCNFYFPAHEVRCPHCAQPSLFPNVTFANADDEVESLQTRYDIAQKHTKQQGLLKLLKQLEKSASQSEACFSRYMGELTRLSSSDQELYASFYQLVDAGIRVPDDNKWDKVREVVDAKVFSYYKAKVQFALLTCNKMGLSYYGDCSFVLKEDMIAHRATAFEENSISFMDKHHIGVTENLPTGYRATWAKRGQLAAAKLHGRLRPGMSTSDVSSLLFTPQTLNIEADFIEVHILGPISIRTISHVTLHNNKSKKQNRANKVNLKAIKERLSKLNITWDTEA